MTVALKTIRLKTQTVLANPHDQADFFTADAGLEVSYQRLERAGKTLHRVSHRIYEAIKDDAGNLVPHICGHECYSQGDAEPTTSVSPIISCVEASEKPQRTPRTLINTKSGQSIQTTLTNAEAASLFAEEHGGNDSQWLWFWIHKAVSTIAERQEEGIPSPKESTKALDFIADSFVVAVGYGLKRPMIRVHFRDQRFKLYLSGQGTVCVKTGGLTAPAEDGSRDPVGDEEYMGCFLKGGFSPAKSGHWDNENRRWFGDRTIRTLNDVEKEFLAELGKDPVSFLARCGKDRCRCCYCNLPLEDPRSKAVGYGPVCAVRWGLAYDEVKAGEKVPSFAASYNEEAHNLIVALRQTPQDEQLWSVFADWLELEGLPRCEMPALGVVLPRND